MTNSFAFIFDMDGTMIDNMHYHELAWQEILKRAGKDLSIEELKPTLYGKNEEVIRRHFGDRLSKSEIQRLGDKKEVLYCELYTPHVKLIDGLESFLKKAHSQNIPMTISTAADFSNVEFILNVTATRSYFKAIITAEQTTKGKPDPEVFLIAASQLQIQPDHCIVFEDAPKGAEAAHRGGMKSVMITTSYGEMDLKKLPGVIEVISDFNYITPEGIIAKAAINF